LICSKTFLCNSKIFRCAVKQNPNTVNSGDDYWKEFLIKTPRILHASLTQHTFRGRKTYGFLGVVGLLLGVGPAKRLKNNYVTPISRQSSTHRQHFEQIGTRGLFLKVLPKKTKDTTRHTTKDTTTVKRSMHSRARSERQVEDNCIRDSLCRGGT
jgi:hypothetical protein